MGRSWNRYDASLEDIKRCRKAILSQFPNATDIYFDEYLVDRHQNESCNANKFYYGAVLETKDGRFQAATSYGRIGDYNKAFGGIKAFDEGSFTNFDSAKRKLNEKLDKKKRGKRCSKCKTRQRYSPFAPKNAEEYGADSVAKSDLDYIKKLTDSFMSKNPTVMGEYGPFGYYKLYEHPVRGDSDYLYFYTPTMGGLVVNSGLEHKNQMNDTDAVIVSKNLVKLLKQDNLYHTDFLGHDDQINWNALYEGTENVYFAEEYGAETEGWVLYSPSMGRSGVFTTKDDAEKVKNWYMRNAPPHYNIENTMKIVPANANDDELDNRSKQILLVGMRYDAENMSPQVFGKLVGQYPQPPNNPLPVGGFMDEGFEWTVNQAEMGKNIKFCNGCNKRNNFENGECNLCGAPEGYEGFKPLIKRSSNIVSRVKNNWLNGLIGVGLGLVGFDFLKKKGYVANADTLIESPNTGDLTPADYEEIVVESTGYAVPIIPVSLDGSFMGSRFHALPTDRYVYDSPEGIGAHSDVAMKRNTTFLPNEQSLVQASEAPGQSPYNSILPNGQENTDFPLRVIHETTTVSLDPSTAPFIPTDMSGYTGQQFIPTSVYEDMLGVGISGRVPSFSQPASGDIGSNHFGSRIANPDMLTNVGGPLTDSVNGDYTDGSTTMSLSQWSIENQVQQISDTEAIVVERGSGGRKMIRRV